jgi:uncharacterized Zn-binding protein involved in type VI secretion
MTKVAVNTNTVSVSPFTPTPVLTNTRFVKINGLGVVLVGDSVDTHTDFGPIPDVIHSGATTTSTQSYVKVNGVAVVVNNSPTTCSHTVVGTGFVDIN